MNIIDCIVVHDFNYKRDINATVHKGFLAQEVYKIKPECVRVGSDDVDEEGNKINPWGVDYSAFVPELVLYCQDLKKL